MANSGRPSEARVKAESRRGLREPPWPAPTAPAGQDSQGNRRPSLPWSAPSRATHPAHARHMHLRNDVTESRATASDFQDTFRACCFVPAQRDRSCETRLRRTPSRPGKSVHLRDRQSHRYHSLQPLPLPAAPTTGNADRREPAERLGVPASVAFSARDFRQNDG